MTEVKMTLEEAQSLMTAIEIGKISFERDEKIRIWDGKAERLTPIAEHSYPTQQLYHSIASASEIIRKKVNAGMEEKYRQPKPEPVTRLEVMDFDD